MRIVVCIPFLILLFFSACLPHKILMQTQSIGIPKNNGYTYENDSIKIIYTFWELQGAMNFEIWNKSSAPIFIDWKNSDFIRNGEKLDYWQDRAITNTTEKGGSYYYGAGISSHSKKSKSISVKDERITILPPRSKIIKESFDIYTDVKMPKSMINQSWNKSNSPFFFRNYIAISRTENADKLQYIDNWFFLSKTSLVKSHGLNKYKNNGDFFLP